MFRDFESGGGGSGSGPRVHVCNNDFTAVAVRLQEFASAPNPRTDAEFSMWIDAQGANVIVESCHVAPLPRLLSFRQRFWIAWFYLFPGSRRMCRCK